MCPFHITLLQWSWAMTTRRAPTRKVEEEIDNGGAPPKDNQTPPQGNQDPPQEQVPLG